MFVYPFEKLSIEKFYKTKNMNTTLKKSIRKCRFLLAIIGFAVCQSITMAQTTWNINGNAGSFSDFIGTTNNYPFLFRTNNVERMRIQPNGFVGIGVANPLQRLDVFGNLRVRGNIYVDQNVFQQGQFDADSIDAGMLNAGDITAAKVSADSIKSHVYKMDENSKFIGESKFQNSVKIQENLLIGVNATNETLEKFEVRGGNAKFEGDVKLNQRLVFGNNGYGLTFIPSSETDSTSYMRFGDGEVSEVSPHGNVYDEEFYTCNRPKPVTSFDFYNQLRIFRRSNYSGGSMHTLTMSCDGTNANIDVVGKNNPTVGNPSLLINYYCGKDIHAVTGVNGGKLIVGKPQNTELAFNVRGNSVLEGNLDVWGTTWLNGNVRIGNDNSTVGDTKLAVEGIVLAREVKVTQGVIWPDYVFKKNYKLLSLKETEDFILQNGHLPETPSSKEIENNGLSIAEMLTLQMKKIEELTLHVIEQQKEIDRLKGKLIINK
jgi:hypothetical protein